MSANTINIFSKTKLFNLQTYNFSLLKVIFKIKNKFNSWVSKNQKKTNKKQYHPHAPLGGSPKNTNFSKKKVF